METIITIIALFVFIPLFGVILNAYSIAKEKLDKSTKPKE